LSSRPERSEVEGPAFPSSFGVRSQDARPAADMTLADLSLSSPMLDLH